ncbi:MAG: DUF72 domain-containing protein, partial [Lautropia sp.]|nr:DUF72 domain-containing protein [Lautropia sp.]
TANFFASGVLDLRAKLGPILWQFPPNLKFKPEVMEAFLQSLPRDTLAAAELATHHDAPSGGGVRPLATSSGASGHAAWRSALRVRQPIAPGLFPGNRDRVPALRHEERRIRGDRGRRTRRHCRYLAFHGRRLDAQPRGRAECRPGLQAARKPPHEGVHRSGPVLHLLLRYTQAVISQMAQTAVCNRHHSLDQ